MSQIFLSPDENGADIANEAINTQTNIEEDDDFMSDFEFVAPVSTQTSSTVPPSPPSSSSSSTNNVLALFSSIFGAALFVVTQNQPSVSGPALLRTMELSSPTVQAAVCNGKVRH